MAGSVTYNTGIGGTSGASLVSLSPLTTNGSIYYVHSATGSDAAAPRGKERVRPLATLAQAVTNAGTADDIIVLLSGHQETLTATQTFAIAGVKVLGEGTGSSRPKFTRDFNGVMFDCTADDLWFENIYFVASASASAAARMRTNVNRTAVVNCYYECGANDTGTAYQINTGAGSLEILDTTFISTATAVASQPARAVEVTAALGKLTMNNVTFTGGTVGWSDPYAFNGNAGAITRLRATNIDLLVDSDILLNASTTGHIHVRNKSGSARVVW